MKPSTAFYLGFLVCYVLAGASLMNVLVTVGVPYSRAAAHSFMWPSTALATANNVVDRRNPAR